jgi:hypothetical protein
LNWGLHLEPFFVKGFFGDRVSRTICPADLNRDPPDLCLLSSQDYRREPLAPDSEDFFKFLKDSYSFLMLGLGH